MDRLLRLASSKWLVLYAGIALVTCGPESNSSEAADEPVALRLSDEPVMSIGVIDGDEPYQLVRVTSGWKQANGRIVVLDPGKAALLFYDSTGKFLKRTGGRGQGPGEMQQVAVGWPYRGDSIAVFDFLLRRVTIYDPDGFYARSFQNPVTFEREPGTVPSQSCCAIRGVFADGSFVGHPPDVIPTAPGPDRYSTFTPWWISPDGTETRPIATFESALFRHDATRPNDVSSYVTSFPFRYAVMNDRLIGGNGFGQWLQSAAVVRNSNGAEVSVSFDSVHLPRHGEPFSEELQAAYEQALRVDYQTNPNRYEGTLESFLQADYPETTPAFVSITSDADSRIWLGRWTPERGSVQRQYDLITVDGTHVGTIHLRAGSSVLWAGNGQALLLERDDMDVQYVRLYNIAREAAAS